VDAQASGGVRAWLWMLRRYGWRSTWVYWRAYREGLLIDYAAIFTADEWALLEEHDLTPPWRRLVREVERG
jgi:hypothetical protein